jgi:flagellar hook protein FlgE
MFSGVSGLRVHQTKMDVIANNISNVNTTAYKSSRATFSEVFSQTLSGASAPNDFTKRGGINPMQIGLGVNLASIDKSMTNGAAQRTDNPLDLMIQGDGFFIMADGSGTYFTRAGSFTEDMDGFLSQNGMKLMGWDAQFDPQIKEFAIERGSTVPLQISGSKEYMLPAITTQVNFSGNINPNTDPVVRRTMSFYDSVGTKYLLDVTMEFQSTPQLNGSQWTLTFGDEIYVNGDRSKPVAIGPPTAVVIDFDANGVYSSTQNMAVNIVPSANLSPGATIGGNGGQIDLNFSDLFQFVNENTNAIALNKDGNPPGHLSGLSVGGDGKITGRYSNGTTRLLGQVPLAKFKNPEGLEKMGQNLFSTTPNSGGFDGVGTDGEMQGGVLEMSNVDLSQEFTEMITTQRGFQANSRVITTSDDMLQELVNLKR